MARKILNRKELRAAEEAAAAAGTSEEKGAKKAAPKKPTARKSRAKTPKEVRLKAFWVVFNQTGKPVAQFDYSDRKLADKKAGELNASQKTPHYVAVLKKTLEE